jgi:hypothetical protein
VPLLGCVRPPARRVGPARDGGRPRAALQTRPAMPNPVDALSARLPPGTQSIAAQLRGPLHGASASRARRARGPAAHTRGRQSLGRTTTRMEELATAQPCPDTHTFTPTEQLTALVPGSTSACSGEGLRGPQGSAVRRWARAKDRAAGPTMPWVAVARCRWRTCCAVRLAGVDPSARWGPALSCPPPPPLTLRKAGREAEHLLGAALGVAVVARHRPCAQSRSRSARRRRSARVGGGQGSERAATREGRGGAGARAAARAGGRRGACAWLDRGAWAPPRRPLTLEGGAPDRSRVGGSGVERLRPGAHRPAHAAGGGR